MFGWFKKKRARVLLVDDEQHILEPFKERLAMSGYEVFTAKNGQQGLIRALKYKPDLILLDTNMPFMDGRQMLERLRENPEGKYMNVIMLTGCKQIADINEADKLGVIDYVTKPFDIHDLMLKIEDILQRSGTFASV